LARRNTEADFHTKYKKLTSGCWEWQRTKNRKGYGQFRINGVLHIAHRYMVQLYTEIPPKHIVMHSCDNPSCVNPEHLEIGTNDENMADMYLKERHCTFKKTHCSAGHELTPENTRVRKHDRSRCCRTCERRRCISYYNRIRKHKLKALKEGGLR